MQGNIGSLQLKYPTWEAILTYIRTYVQSPLTVSAETDYGVYRGGGLSLCSVRMCKL